MAQWSVTGKCNYRCRHCFLSAPHAKLGELPKEGCLKIIDELARCGIRSISLTGGEPLIRRDFFELVDALAEKEIRVDGIYSNGKLVTGHLLDELENVAGGECNVFGFIGDTVHGPSCNAFMN